MRICVEFETKTDHLPVDYRPCFISLLKKSLENYENGNYFADYFGHTNRKPYCFAVRFPKGSKIGKGSVTLSENKLNMVISTSDDITSIIFNNALLLMKKKEFPLPAGNAMHITNIRADFMPMVTGNAVGVQFVSPLCLRHKNNSDSYAAFPDNDFEETFKGCVKHMFCDNTVDIDIVPIDMKPVYVKHYNGNIPCTVGYAVITGNQTILQKLLMDGIGSRRSQGFGLIRQITEEEVQQLCLKHA